MNSRRKYRTSVEKPVPLLKAKQDWAKYHCLHYLFAEAAGGDPYLLKHIKEAIDQSIAEEPEMDDTVEAFAETAMRLSQNQPFKQSSYGLFHLKLEGQPFDPLFVRQELVRGLKSVAGYDSALLLITGLRESITCGKPFTRKQQERHEEARGYIDALASQFTTANAELSILYV
ncbi:MAG: hypothetical protein E1N59_2455 [Puniceicoccaceae bacterium 5H]|nr:MAG: hypothetical protein E1N59_2455 [Puniceicoccaceae bacterium 5H]